ncbi:MAG TPA: thioredoxin-like domain-containing protein [Pyrinomonadaceae bacterium]|nr:thioredoxin-like domain-containing protein [Pyrinomonadaceae bacterium]
MTTIWLISHAVLWLVVGLLSVLVILLARQMGLIYRRLGSAPARMENDGPAIGESVPEMTVRTLAGETKIIGGSNLISRLLVFVSVGCPACNLVAPAVRAVSKKERSALETLIVSISADERAVRDFVKRNKLLEVPCIISNELAKRYEIHGPPYGVLLDRDGVVRAKGLINNMDHIESLINAAEIGYASSTAYISAINSSDPALAMD